MTAHNIWLLVDSSKAGGIESHILQLAQGLQDHGQSPMVIFLRDYGEHPLKKQLTQHAISHHILEGGFVMLCRQLKKQPPTILHTHGYKAGILGRLAACLYKIPVISTYHAGEIGNGKLALYDRIDRLTAFLATQVFAVSPQIAERIPGDIKIFDNFVNTANIQDSLGQKIAFVGRVSHEKGPDHFAYLANQVTDIKFHLYGGGPLLTELQKNAPNNLKLHGQQDDMQKIWSEIGLLVIPSRYEGLPMAALEAMARGIPVLAFRVGALDKLICNDINGWVIEPGDLVQMLQKIKLWRTIPELKKQQMRDAAKNTIANKFSSQVAIPKLIASYQKCAN